MLYEAPHGTAHDLFIKYQESGGKVALFNSSALLYAVANGLDTLAERENNTELKAYSDKLKAALIETVAQGYITADLRGKTKNPEQEKIVDMYGFIDQIERNLQS